MQYLILTLWCSIHCSSGDGIESVPLHDLKKHNLLVRIPLTQSQRETHEVKMQREVKETGVCWCSENNRKLLSFDLLLRLTYRHGQQLRRQQRL